MWPNGVFFLADVDHTGLLMFDMGARSTRRSFKQSIIDSISFNIIHVLYRLLINSLPQDPFGLNNLFIFVCIESRVYIM